MLPGQAMKNSEYEYDRRTKTILEVRGRENLVLVGVRFSSPAIVLQSSSSSYSFLPLAAKARMWAYLKGLALKGRKITGD
jgi:hypothetical protein